MKRSVRPRVVRMVIISVVVVGILLVVNGVCWRGGVRRESFATMWPSEVLRQFLAFQRTMFAGRVQYDLMRLQEQATPEEVDTLLRTGYWPWPESLQQQYIDQCNQSNTLGVPGNVMMHNARRIYNASAANELLRWNTPEGRFLLYGTQTPDGYVQCRPRASDGQSVLYRDDTPITDMDAQVGATLQLHTPCNPCSPLDNPEDNSCPFSINNQPISQPWAEWWT